MEKIRRKQRRQKEKDLIARMRNLLLILVLVTIGACDMASSKPPISGETAQLVKEPVKLENHVKTHAFKIDNKTVDGADFDERRLQNIQITNTNLTQYWHRRGWLLNSSYKDVVFDVGSFSNTTLTNVIFENAFLPDIGFINTNFIDVTFKNCKFVGNKMLGIKGKVTFIDSELDSVDFHEAQAAITLINSRVHNTTNPRNQTFTNQQIGASIDMTDSTLTEVKVGGTLASFKAKGGKIVKSSIGNTIKTVLLDNIYLDMSMVGTIDDLRVSNATLHRFAIGEMKINHIFIEDCQPSELLSLTDGIYSTLTIRNCSINQFKPWGITTGEFSITDSTFTNTIMSGSKINHLLFKNVTFDNGKFDNAIAKETQISGVKLGAGEFSMSGTNIQLR